MNRLKIKDVEWLPQYKAARAWSFENRGHVYYIICIPRDSVKKYTLSEVAGLIAHEVMHVWQYIKENIGEDSPGAETEAYFMQNLVAQIMHHLTNK